MPNMILPSFLRFIDRLGGTSTVPVVFSAASLAEPIAPIRTINPVSKANSQQGRPRPAAKPHIVIKTELVNGPNSQLKFSTTFPLGQKSFISNLHVMITLEKNNDCESLVQIDFGDFDSRIVLLPFCIVQTDNFQFHEVELIMSKIRMYVTHPAKKHHEL
jgi:hypothetical protein